MKGLVCGHVRAGLTRRAWLAGSAASIVAVAQPMAREERVPFGAAVMISDFRSDARLREMLVRHCDLIVPMNELKWDWVRQNRAGFEFGHADEIIGFARRNGKSAYGHALLWGDALPAWVKAISEPRELERELNAHIERVVGKYAGVIPAWDVTNEVIAHEPTPARPWRDTVWQRVLGPRHVDIAFAAAAKADPKAQLVLNDYDLENPDPRTAERRRQTLAIVRHLQSQRIPVHQVGLQAHLYAERPIDRRGITAFCRELGRLGVGVRITELDVIDWRLPAAVEARDRSVADLVRSFLEAVFEGQRPTSLVTWGLSDKSSWIHETFRRQDRARARPLPFDEDYRPKPMWDAIQQARLNAAPRS